MTNRNDPDTEHKIRVMSHYFAGGDVEIIDRNPSSNYGSKWSLCESPNWNWWHYDYRIANIKPSIDWSQIVLDYKWLAVDMDGRGFVYIHKPDVYESSGLWGSETRNLDDVWGVTALVSFDKGNCDWKQSLVQRPE